MGKMLVRPRRWVFQCRVTCLRLYAKLYLARLPAKWICVAPAGIKIPLVSRLSSIPLVSFFLIIGDAAVKLYAHYDRGN